MIYKHDYSPFYRTPAASPTVNRRAVDEEKQNTTREVDLGTVLTTAFSGRSSDPKPDFKGPG